MGHPYLERKGITAPSEVKQHDGCLVIPVFGVNGELNGIQQIDTDGRKRFLEEHPKAAADARRERARRMLTETLKSLAADRFIGARENDEAVRKILDDLADRKEDPYTAAEKLLAG